MDKGQKVREDSVLWRIYVLNVPNSRALLNRFTDNPIRIYGIVTIVLFVVTLDNPFFNIPNIPLGMGIWLDVMHAVVAGVAWYAFSRYTKK